MYICVTSPSECAQMSLEMKRMPILDLDLAETEAHHAFVHVNVGDIMCTNVCTVGPLHAGR